MLDELQICKQYIRFFDVDRKDTEQPAPKSVIRFRALPLAEVIPVIYITNRTFQDLSIIQGRLLISGDEVIAHRFLDAIG